MTQLAHDQRQALCDVFDRLGPDAPTLNEGWTTRDLAAHLATRDRRPDALAGIAVPALAAYTAKVQEGYARRPWPELVDLVRFGPPAYAVTRVRAVDEKVNLAEMYIHHEDVLRAQEPPSHVPMTPQLESALWTAARAMSRLSLARCPVGVTLSAPGHGEAPVRKPGPKGHVRLTGRPGDLLLYLSGRSGAADVTVEGAPDAEAAFRAQKLGL